VVKVINWGLVFWKDMVYLGGGKFEWKGVSIDADNLVEFKKKVCDNPLLEKLLTKTKRVIFLINLNTNHINVIFEFRPKIITYSQLLDIFDKYLELRLKLGDDVKRIEFDKKRLKRMFSNEDVGKESRNGLGYIFLRKNGNDKSILTFNVEQFKKIIERWCQC